MKILILVEGETEKAFKPILSDFLKSRLEQLPMPKLKFMPYKGRIPKGEKLKRVVENSLNQDNYDAVIALTDVYTGKEIDFQDAADAKAKMREWVGNNPNFYPHTAQHDFEAWLLPYWLKIQKLAGHNKSVPGGSPEQVNHGNSPAYRIQEIFKLGKKRDYNKIRDGSAILKDQDLMVSVNQCPELKSFINTILKLCKAKLIP